MEGKFLKGLKKKNLNTLKGGAAKKLKKGGIKKKVKERRKKDIQRFGGRNGGGRWFRKVWGTLRTGGNRGIFQGTGERYLFCGHSNKSNGSTPSDHHKNFRKEKVGTTGGESSFKTYQGTGSTIGVNRKAGP